MKKKVKEMPKGMPNRKPKGPFVKEAFKKASFEKGASEKGPSLKAQVSKMMLELSMEPKKMFGQNFLISEFVIEKILKAVSEFSPSSIIEVGPGLGSLTRGLQKITKHLTLIEIDKNLVQYWTKENHLIDQVIEEDALRLDWNDLILSQIRSFLSPPLLVSNLPYQISSSLIIDRTLDQVSLSGMILMFQKEVAQKILAQKNQSLYGWFSVFIQTYWKIEFLLEASSGDFFPAPKVASRVLVFRPKGKALEKQIENQTNNQIEKTLSRPLPLSRSQVLPSRISYLKFLKACFLQPRKFMISNLSSAWNRSKDELESVFSSLGISLKARAQDLTLDQYLELYEALKHK